MQICHQKYKTVDECIEDSGCGDLKPQPGDFDLIKRTGSDKTKERIYKCPQMHHKILNDNPSERPSMSEILNDNTNKILIKMF